jgi:hypothetical protein
MTVMSSRGDNNNDLESGFEDSINDKFFIGDSIKNRNALTDKKKAI